MFEILVRGSCFHGMWYTRCAHCFSVYSSLFGLYQCGYCAVGGSKESPAILHFTLLCSCLPRGLCLLLNRIVVHFHQILCSLLPLQSLLWHHSSDRPHLVNYSNSQSFRLLCFSSLYLSSPNSNTSCNCLATCFISHLPS